MPLPLYLSLNLGMDCGACPPICFRYRVGEMLWYNCRRAIIVEMLSESTEPFYLVKINQEYLKVPECALKTECVRPIRKPIIPSVVTTPQQGKKSVKIVVESDPNTECVRPIRKPIIPSVVTTPQQGKKSVKIVVESDPNTDVAKIQKILDRLNKDCNG